MGGAFRADLVKLPRAAFLVGGIARYHGRSHEEAKPFPTGDD
jgi:hypothetical protein